MIEQLIDVTMGERILHTFPITIRNPLSETRDEAFKEKALEAAANAHLVADEELGRLRANVHVSRSGPLESWGDSLGVLAETKTGLDQIVRDRAYSLWERAGRPNGVAEECWIGLTRFGGRVVLSFLLDLFAVDDAPSVIGLSMRRSV
jgi:hypothetical protein